MKSVKFFIASHRRAMLFFGAVFCISIFGINTRHTNAELRSPVITRAFRVVSTTATPGTQVSVSVELDSNGDEVATSFTLNFDPTKLSAPAVTLGSGVPAGTALTVNSNQAGSGRVGILVDSSNSFSASGPPRQVVMFRFNVAAGATAGASAIAFGSSPTPRSTSDPDGNGLSATYQDGIVDIQPAQASTFSVGGRITNPNGQGLRNATVFLQDPQGARRTTTTSSFGFYQFDNVLAGGPYTIGVTSRLYRFQSVSLNVNNDLTNVDLVGLE